MLERRPLARTKEQRHFSWRRSHALPASIVSVRTPKRHQSCRRRLSASREINHFSARAQLCDASSKAGASSRLFRLTVYTTAEGGKNKVGLTDHGHGGPVTRKELSRSAFAASFHLQIRGGGDHVE
ncbi:hypothetical protein MRX96_011406 [Rhipicephalus microplus]